jgi:hypothetical protein
VAIPAIIARTIAMMNPPRIGEIVDCNCHTRPSMSPYPWQEPHGSPFVEAIFFFVNGKAPSLAFSAHESQLFPFSPVEQVPFPSQCRQSIAIDSPCSDAGFSLIIAQHPGQRAGIVAASIQEPST